LTWSTGTLLTGSCAFAALIVLAPGEPKPARAGVPTVSTDSALQTWLFPRPAAALPGTPARAPYDSVTPLAVPRGRRTFVDSRLHDLFFAPDWDSTSHAPMPAVVSHGRRPAVYACGYCHMPDGAGRPENAALAGLPAAYIVQQVRDIATHARRSAVVGEYAPVDNMSIVSGAVNAAELESAADYFASLRLRSRTRIVEAAMIPKLVAGVGLFHRSPRGGTERLAGRLVEVSDDEARHERRDPSVRYVAYVPRGSVACGRALAGRPIVPGTPSCAGCHGPQLKGLAGAPPLAARSPGYLLRQLLAFKGGQRDTPASAPMKIAASALTLDEMIALAAYLATLSP
jgi:cytochrome c553